MITPRITPKVTPKVTRRPILAGLAAAAIAGAARADDLPYAGVWWGVLNAGQLHIRLRIEVRPDGALTFASPDQGAADLPARFTSTAGTDFNFEVPVVQGVFVGHRTAPDRIEGIWRQGGGELPLTFGRTVPPPPASVDVPAVFRAPPEALTQARLEAFRAADNLPALVATAAKAGEAAHTWVTGERLRGSGRTVTEADLWHIGSMTKSMTATLVGRYVDAGQLHWDDTVGDLLGAAIPDMRPEYRAVTFRHLLSHRSGLPGNIPTDRVETYSRFLDDARQERRAYAREALRMAPLAAPGARYEYANNGYIVVGAILEAKFGDAWETQIRQKLFDPLGMTSAGFGPPGHPGAVDQPIGHVLGPDGPTPVPYNGGLLDNPAALGPAGRVHVNLGDLLTYVSAHRERSSLLRPETWDTLHTAPFGGNYAFGWIVNPDGVRWHNGSNTLFYSEMAFNRATGVATASASNCASGARAVDRVLLEGALAVR